MCEAVPHQGSVADSVLPDLLVCEAVPHQGSVARDRAVQLLQPGALLLHTHTQIVQKYCADRHTQVVSIPGSFVDPHHVDVDPAQPVQIGVDTNLLIYY